MPTTKAKPFTSPPVESALPAAEFIPASQFRRSPDNRKPSAAHVAQISDSIRLVGLLQPITARPIENSETGGTDLEIVLGECRWHACKELDDSYPVPCFIRNLTDKEAARIRAVENFQRQDLDEIEEALAIQNLKATGWTVEEMMDFLGRKKDHIYQRLTLLKLSEEAHSALRDGNITIHTAVKLASLPEENRAAALKAVVTPTHAAKSLPERQALELLDREFIEPAKLAKEWDKRRDVILENHSGAKWNNYEDARKISSYKSGYVKTDTNPDFRHLSDAAQDDELIVPTWGELAKKHGAQIVIGCGHNDEAGTYILPQPIIDAEKAAFSDKPEECIFKHEAAVHKAREAADQSKREREAHDAALQIEKVKIAALVLSTDGISINKTATKKLVEMSFLELNESYGNMEDLSKVLEIDISADGGDEKTEASVIKYLRSKTISPHEAAGRLLLASWIVSAYEGQTCEILFESGAIKAADFPAMHREYTSRRARKSAHNKADEAASSADTQTPEQDGTP